MKKGFTMAVLIAALLWIPGNYASAEVDHMLPKDLTPEVLPANSLCWVYPVALNGAIAGFQFTWALAIANLTNANLPVTVESRFLTGSVFEAQIGIIVPGRRDGFVTPSDISCPSPGCALFVCSAPNNVILQIPELITIAPPSFVLEQPRFFLQTP